MAGQHCAKNSVFYVDCAGTVATASGAEAAATSSSHARAHMWANFFATHSCTTNLDGQRAYTMVKVEGHATLADVANGIIPVWQCKGNNGVDEFAKAGAQMHNSSGADPV